MKPEKGNLKQSQMDDHLEEVANEEVKQTKDVKENAAKKKSDENVDGKEPTEVTEEGKKKVENEDTKKQKENEEDSEEKESFLKEALSWVCTVVIALFLGWFLSRVVLFNANVPTTSMESTIMKGDNLIGFRLAYMFSEPERGDVVIFPYPDNTKVNYVKRIIGMPGETVEVRDQKVYINGEALDESAYLSVVTDGNCGPFVVPEDSYFMMGDNRNASLDSRYWENKFVKKDDIIAKVIFRYYPSIAKIE